MCFLNDNCTDKSVIFLDPPGDLVKWQISMDSEWTYSINCSVRTDSWDMMTNLTFSIFAGGKGWFTEPANCE